MAERRSSSGRDGRSEARTQGACRLVCLDATEDAASGRPARPDGSADVSPIPPGSSGARATLRLVPRQSPAFRAYTGTTPPRFVNEVELECAKMLDYYGVPWEYEPTTFVLERDPDGREIGRAHV